MSGLVSGVKRHGMKQPVTVSGVGSGAVLVLLLPLLHPLTLVSGLVPSTAGGRWSPPTITLILW